MSKVSLLALAMSAGAAPVLAQVAADDEIQSHEAQIASDAATRTSLATNEASPFTLRQPGVPTVEVGGLFQARYTANIRDDEGMEEGFTHGFSVRRARINTLAHLNETWSVFLQGQFDPDNGEFNLLDAWADWETSETWTWRFGQFKVPTLRENLIGAEYQQAADRSVTNEVFNLGRSQGIAALYGGDTWRFYGAFTDGANAAEGLFNSGMDADYAFTGRAEWLFSGQWEALRDFAGWRGQEYHGMVGGALHYQDGGDTGVGSMGTTTEIQVLQATVDAQVEGNGWNAFGAVIWSRTDNGTEADNFGVVLQGGIFVDDSNELFARGDLILPDSEFAADDEFLTITAGWNHYFIPESHASKFTLDVQVFLGATDDTALVDGGITNVGLLDAANDTQFALRAQYQGDF